jgi:glycosyltransferase involved in cell wall biosynthesis
MSREPALLILSHDVVGAKMAGPGIRYFHLARVLAAHLPVTLGVPGPTPPDLGSAPFAVTTWRNWEELQPVAAQATVILAPSDLTGLYPQLGDGPAALVIDGYDPLLSEWLAMHHHLPMEEQQRRWQIRLAHHAVQFHVGDFYICASERQRDWWIGQLEALGRINPATYAGDPTLRRFLDVTPYGLPETPPQATRPTLKGVWPGIAATDRVVLWGGGLWPWLDPETAIRAVAQVVAHRPEVKLIFPGTRHPNPILVDIPTSTTQARCLAQELGLLDQTVFFGDWVPYVDWPNVLLESDVALSLHLDSLETRLAFRTRILDYVWAGLPMIATTGDATSDLVARYGVGEVVNYQDVAAVAQALLRLLDEPRTARTAEFARAREALTWEQAAAPLVAFCRSPRRAPDRLNQQTPLEAAFAVKAAQAERLDYLEHAVVRAEADAAYWRELATRYEQGRFIRTMRGLDRLARRVWPRP